MKKRVKGRIIGLVLVVILSLLTIGLFIMNVNETHNQISEAEQNKSKTDYEYFKDNTTVIKGEVIDSYIQKNNGSKTYYLVVYHNDDSRKLVNVNKKQFDEYKQGSHVAFRIHREKNNQVVIDLNKDKDIKDKKDYKAFKKKNNKEIWQKMRKSFI